MEFNWIKILLSFVLTFLCYTIVPIIARIFVGAYGNKDARKFAIINSLVVGGIFAILTIEFTDNRWNGTPAVIYFFVNCFILTIGNKKEDIEIEAKEKLSTIKSNIKEEKSTKMEKTMSEKKIKNRYCKYCGGKIDESKKCNKCGKQYFNLKSILAKIDISFVILMVLAVFLGGLNIYQYVKLTEKNEIIADYKSKNTSLSQELREEKDENFDLLLENVELIDKANFLDENIVLVLEGYGNYYYTYDCVEKITNGESYSYWAYNIEAAKVKGYKKGTCD